MENSTEQIPLEWELQYAENIDKKLFPVQTNSCEWFNVRDKFISSLPNATIASIQRVQNHWLWRKYVSKMELLNYKNGGVVKEKKLFHGTRTTDPKEIYGTEKGFDMRFSAQGMWGRANYFAVDASYSHSYAFTSSGYCEIFLARVLTGYSCETKPDSTLRLPPSMPSSAAVYHDVEQALYDSVTGITQGCRVYMTYENDYAYPAYLIRYKM